MTLKSVLRKATRPKKKEDVLSVMARLPSDLKQEVDHVMKDEQSQGKNISWQVLIESAARAYVSK